MIPKPKIVEFEKYCKECEHYETPDYENPCDECLSYPVNEAGSRKPVNWKEKEK